MRHRLLQTVLELGLLLLGVVQGLPDPLQVDKRLAERHVVAKVHRFTVILGKQRPQRLIGRVRAIGGRWRVVFNKRPELPL